MVGGDRKPFSFVSATLGNSALAYLSRKLDLKGFRLLYAPSAVLHVLYEEGEMGLTSLGSEIVS